MTDDTRVTDLTGLAHTISAMRTPTEAEITSAFRPWAQEQAVIVTYVQIACDPADMRAHGAAEALLDLLLPGWSWHTFRGVAEVWNGADPRALVFHKGAAVGDAARAFVLAILNALIAEA